MKCYKCGADNPDDAVFCSECGTKLGISEELISNAKEKSNDAISEIYKETYTDVSMTVLSIVPDNDTANDIVQETYVKAFNSLNQLKEAGKFRAWIRKIAHNKAIDYLRKQKPVVFSEMEDENDAPVQFADERPESMPDVVLDKSETSRLLKEIICSLNADQRSVISLFYYEQYSVKEISEMLDLSENTIKSRLMYARKNIEVRVRQLEKKGTKLYGLSPIPFLLMLFANREKQLSNPDPSVLNAVLKECGSTVSGGLYNGKKASGKSGMSSTSTGNAAKNLKTLVSVGARGAAGKAVIGLTAVCVVTGSAVAYHTLKNSSEDNKTEVAAQTASSDSDSSVQENEQASATPEAIDAESICEPVIKEYSGAMTDLDKNSLEYPDLNQTMLHLFYMDGGYNLADSRYTTGDYSGEYDWKYSGFCYDYYDIDGNGVEELLISSRYYASYEDDPGYRYSISDVYSVVDGTPERVFNDFDLGERANLSIYPDGKMIMIGSGGYNLHSVELYEFNSDGTVSCSSSKTIESETEGDVTDAIKEAVGEEDPVTEFDWKIIDYSWNEESTGDASSYIGTYMNGNDIIAGRVEITEGSSPETVNVTLKSCIDLMNLQTVFTAEATAVSDGLLMTLDGRQIKFESAVDEYGNPGFYLIPSPYLAEEWNIDSYTFCAMYGSIDVGW